MTRLIPAILVAALGAYAVNHQPDHPRRQWWDNHVDPVRVGKDAK